ncbi:exopolysaccharide production protein ExoZ [Burkholderia multivorans]
MKIKENNFDCLRLLAAFLVLFSHQFNLMGLPEPISIGGFQGLGGLGVAIFFSISGYLVCQSWERDPSFIRFSAKRLLRILPGLCVVTVLCACVLGPALTTLPEREYFASAKFWNFFHTIKLVAVSYELPGLFQTNHIQAVNGSLWTLPIEARCYLLLALVGLLGILRRRWLFLMLVVAFAVYIFILKDAQHAVNRKYNYEYGTFFFVGAGLYLFRARWAAKATSVLIGVAILAAVLAACGMGYVGMLITVPPFAIALGTASFPYIRRAGRFGDISYGLYIYAFPVQQTLIWSARHSLGVWPMLALSTVCTTLCGFASWHFVERPALALKPRQRRKSADGLVGDCIGGSETGGGRMETSLS